MNFAPYIGVPEVEIQFCRRHPASVRRAFADMRAYRDGQYQAYGDPPHWVKKRIGVNRYLAAHIVKSARTGWDHSEYVAMEFRTECGLSIPAHGVYMSGSKGPQFEGERKNCWRVYRHMLKILKLGREGKCLRRGKR